MSAPASGSKRKRLVWMLAAFTVGVVVTSATFLMRPSDVHPPMPSFDVPLGGVPGAELVIPFPVFALAPDGRHLALVVRTEGRQRLWLRQLGSSRLSELPGTDSVSMPFWSPDSRRIGVLTNDEKLKTIALDGSGTIPVCSAPRVPGGAGLPAWSSKGFILFQSASGHLLKVAEKGGEPVPATRLEKGHAGHAWPSFLPDGEHFLFFASGVGVAELRVGSLSTTESASLSPIASAAWYASGHLLFLDRGLMVQRFDVESLRRLGEPLPLITQVAQVGGVRSFSVSDTGLLVYREPFSIVSRLTWLDRSGRPVATVGDPGSFANLALNRDENRVAVSRVESSGLVDMWVLDLTRNGDGSRLTTDPAWDMDPGWSNDGKFVVFNSNRQKGYWALFRRAADGSGEDDPVAQLPPPDILSIADPSPDGRFLIAQGRATLWLIENRQGATPVRFMKVDERQRQASFSPDGKWVVYVSYKTGRPEVVVTPFPSADREIKISVQGGYHPRWRADDEIVFLSPDSEMMSARVRRRPDLERDPPERLFSTSLPLGANRPYDVTSDGKRFLMPVPTSDAYRETLHLVTNWTARLPQ